MKVIDTDEIKKEGIKTIKQHCDTSANHAMAVIENDSAIFYCISPILFDRLDDILDNEALATIAKTRLKDRAKTTPINLEDL